MKSSPSYSAGADLPAGRQESLRRSKHRPKGDKEESTYAPVFAGESKLMLAAARESNKKFYPKGLGGSGTQLFVRVENVDDVWERVKEKTEVIDPIETKTWGDREFTLKDPDGYLVSFYSSTGNGAK